MALSARPVDLRSVILLGPHLLLVRHPRLGLRVVVLLWLVTRLLRLRFCVLSALGPTTSASLESILSG